MTLKLAAHGIEGLAGQLHEVKLVEDNLSLRKMGARPLDVGRAHIQGKGFNLGGVAAVLAQGLGKSSQGLRTAALDHEQ